MEERPSLLREIGKVAWFFARVSGAICAVVALYYWLIVYHQLLGIIVFYCLALMALIVFLGWQNYKRKLQDLERRREWEANMEKWKRAS